MKIDRKSDILTLEYRSHGRPLPGSMHSSLQLLQVSRLLGNIRPIGSIEDDNIKSISKEKESQISDGFEDTDTKASNIEEDEEILYFVGANHMLTVDLVFNSMLSMSWHQSNEHANCYSENKFEHDVKYGLGNDIMMDPGSDSMNENENDFNRFTSDIGFIPRNMPSWHVISEQSSINIIENETTSKALAPNQIEISPVLVSTSSVYSTCTSHEEFTPVSPQTVRSSSESKEPLTNMSNDKKYDKNYQKSGLNSNSNLKTSGMTPIKSEFTKDFKNQKIQDPTHLNQNYGIAKMVEISIKLDKIRKQEYIQSDKSMSEKKDVEHSISLIQIELLKCALNVFEKVNIFIWITFILYFISF